MFKHDSSHSLLVKKYWLIANISACLLIILLLVSIESVFAKSPDYQMCEPDNASHCCVSEMGMNGNDSIYSSNPLMFYAIEDTPEPTLTFTPSGTNTNTPSVTYTYTSTTTFTPTNTSTITTTFTPTNTSTITTTFTPSNTFTLTSTFTSTPISTNTPVSTDTPVPTTTPTRANTQTPTAIKQSNHAEDESSTPAQNNWVVYPVKSTVTPTETATQTMSSTSVIVSTDTPINTAVPSDTAISTQTSTAVVVEKTADEHDSHLTIWIISSIGFVLLVFIGSIMYWRRN